MSIESHTRRPRRFRAPHVALAAVFASSMLGGIASAQRPPAQLDGAAILHRLEKLEVVGSVLYVAAHPDDENTRLIAWLSNGRKVRTAYLSLTRGDGGQNLIGPELGDALGVIRTQELLEARRIDGGEQYFSRAVDFGYSKTPEETFEKWGRREILGDVVRVVREFRPDVIVTRFATDGSGTHGHHTASALLAQEAFDLAADPQAFPEQIAAGLEPWQARRLFFNASTWWNKDLAERAAKDPTTWAQAHVGEYDALLGASYTEIAGRSRSQHKSQGFGAAETRGEQIEYLRLDKGAKLATPDLFDGMDLGWSRVEGGQHVRTLLRELIDAYDVGAPEKSLPALADLARALDDLAAAKPAARAWASLQAETVRELIVQVCGAVVEATSSTPRVAVGDTLRVSLSSLQRNPGPALEVVEFLGPDAARIAVGKSLSWNQPLAVEHAFAIPATQPIDQPYWLAAPHDALYRPDRALHAGIEPIASGAARYRGLLRLIDGSTIDVEREAMHTWVHRVAGERTRPVAITPVASIRAADGVAIVRGDHATVAVEVEALTDDLEGTVTAAVPDGWTVDGEPASIERIARGERRTVRFDVRRSPEAKRGAMRFTFAGPKGTTDRTLHAIDYPHILPQTWYTPAEVVLVPQDVAVNVRTVGFIEGAGDDVPQALQRLGVVVERIDPATATASDLARCDAIVTGIRAYNTVAALARFQTTLFEYVERGGTLVVQYVTNGNDLVTSAKKIGPYPFAVTRDRVTVEEAKPTFLAPNHALMNVPNVLTASDFEGWVQERGLYFAGELDPKYTALVAWNDPGESPLSGAWIACDHGQGRFVYTGMSLFRQLPAGVPGAYRILANLVARRGAGE